MRDLGLLVFVSGFSALVCQVVWVRALGRLFGTSTPAIATVVAAFMGGLALLGLDEDRAVAAHAARLARPDARFFLARRAFYSDRYAEALALLSSVSPREVGPAHHALLVGACARALGRRDEATAAFRELARSTRVEPVRALAEALAARPDAPWPPAQGPLAPPTP